MATRVITDNAKFLEKAANCGFHMVASEPRELDSIKEGAVRGPSIHRYVNEAVADVNSTASSVTFISSHNAIAFAVVYGA